MRRRHGLIAAVALACAGTCAVAPLATAHNRSSGPHGSSAAAFTGSCHFAGPLALGRPITVFPVPGAHFSYAGTGTCRGTLDGAAVSSAPLTVTFTNATTLFDTCELGPDLGLHGVAGIGQDSFPITVELARVLLAGPFLLTTPHGGRAIGLAQFQPGDVQASALQCATTGVPSASLSGDFTTVRALSGRR